MKLGLIGCGNVACWLHLRALGRLGVTLVAAADPDPSARERARRLTGVPVYERAEEVFGHDDVQAVVITAPAHLHAPLALATIGLGKHFYLEKPLATSVADGRQVVDAAKSQASPASLDSIAASIRSSNRRGTCLSEAPSGGCVRSRWRRASRPRWPLCPSGSVAGPPAAVSCSSWPRITWTSCAGSWATR